ncbi:MAG: hypothetical protein AB1641_02545 [Thermodesulfobacteriota bacterium]
MTRVYLIAWLIALGAAFIVLFRKRRELGLLDASYLKFLVQPWKLGTFILAVTGLAAVAPVSGDPTWDYADAIGMGVLTYFTAPWSVGTIYRLSKVKAPAAPFMWPSAWDCFRFPGFMMAIYSCATASIR